MFRKQFQIKVMSVFTSNIRSTLKGHLQFTRMRWQLAPIATRLLGHVTWRESTIHPESTFTTLSLLYLLPGIFNSFLSMQRVLLVSVCHYTVWRCLLPTFALSSCHQQAVNLLRLPIPKHSCHEEAALQACVYGTKILESLPASFGTDVIARMLGTSCQLGWKMFIGVRVWV